MDTPKFVTESNLIEGINRPPTQGEITEHERFVALDSITVQQLANFVSVYQAGANIRSHYGMDVRVGKHIPPSGGPRIVELLTDLLSTIDDMTPYQAHVAYETLHPFTDGNRRSGRVLWAWHMRQTVGDSPLGFLHHFYYQALDGGRVML
jgi:hypothetical protein